MNALLRGVRRIVQQNADLEDLKSVYIAVKAGIETMNAEEVVHRDESLRKRASEAGKIGGKAVMKSLGYNDKGKSIFGVNLGKASMKSKGYDEEGKSVHASEAGKIGGKAVMKSLGYNDEGKSIFGVNFARKRTEKMGYNEFGMSLMALNMSKVKSENMKEKALKECNIMLHIKCGKCQHQLTRPVTQCFRENGAWNQITCKGDCYSKKWKVHCKWTIVGEDPAVRYKKKGDVWCKEEAPKGCNILLHIKCGKCQHQLTRPVTKCFELNGVWKKITCNGDCYSKKWKQHNNWSIVGEEPVVRYKNKGDVWCKVIVARR